MVLSLVVLLLVVGGGFLMWSPQFGGTVSEAQKKEYAKTGHYRDQQFTNPEPIDLRFDCHSIPAMIKQMLRPNPKIRPQEDLAVNSLQKHELQVVDDGAARLTWLGHSSFLIHLDGQTILLDPVMNDYAAPHPWLGRKRFSEVPLNLDDLNHVDAVIISHDHYDHLDYESIQKLKNKTEVFFVPLGVGNHLKRWGISENHIQELDWWEETECKSVRLVFTPARHMSGRGLADQKSTLWGSWVIQGKQSKIYFSGDGGYGKHFKEIGERYGPFDIGLMECGQYNDLWQDVHMVPEETVQAGLEVGAKYLIPIHWGAFALADHPWEEPVKRLIKAGEHKEIKICTPVIGQSLELQNMDSKKSKWWESIN